MMKIIMYGAEWCADCIRAKMFFRNNSVEFDYRDIDIDGDALESVRKYNKYKSDSIPVIVFEDGTVLIEPTYYELSVKFKNV